MKRSIMALLLWAGCQGDDGRAVADAGPDAMYCDTDAGTPYGGPVVTCAGGAGLCVAGTDGFGDGQTCYPRCADVPPLCPPYYIGMTIRVGGEVTDCYCKPHRQ